MIDLIREYSDIFAWGPKDMSGIPETIVWHSLHVNTKVCLICQKKKTFSKEKWAAIDEELNRLFDTNFIEPVKFLTWIANVVLVNKSNGK